MSTSVRQLTLSTLLPAWVSTTAEEVTYHGWDPRYAGLERWRANRQWHREHCPVIRPVVRSLFAWLDNDLDQWPAWTGPLKKRRERRHESRYKYVRKTAGRMYQARVWLGEFSGGSLNLGLYESECLANAVVKKAIAEKQLPPGIPPKYAFKRHDGLWEARCIKHGRSCVLGPFQAAGEACRAMVDYLEAEFPQERPFTPNPIFDLRKLEYREPTGASVG